ncbi:hypothetical protein RvY_08198 [Ramazzottius varieornatus]|uniref:Uncharacterized protein n=1 Tax=Ramazzottius varieornatus TaxID=947166 RepID=A0A1D1V532_RAMVA|nr:hypothetical protein RvY_08198 [Ramazzottius varieornatus]
MAGESRPATRQPEAKQCTTELAKKACRLLDKIWNSNMQATIGDISRLFWAQGFCNLFCSLILISFSGICSTRKYNDDCEGEAQYLEEDDRQSLAILCVIVGLVGLMQSAINGATLARLMVLIAPQTELSKAWLRQVQMNQTLGQETKAASTAEFSDPQDLQKSARRFRIRNVVFAVTTLLTALGSAFMVTGLDAWFTDFGLVLGGYMAAQIVQVGFLLRGAFVSIDGKAANELQRSVSIEMGGDAGAGGADGENGLLITTENEVAQLKSAFTQHIQLKDGNSEGNRVMTVEV